jgi:predicted nucleic acid-binding protein
VTRTFVDAGVLIAAACGVPNISDIALRLLDEPKRVFITSDLVRLEVLPKPTYHGFQDEVAFYEAFFTNARRVAVSKQLLEDALREACQWGLSACDAIHVAAAKRAKCVEFHTTEKPSKPLFRVSGIRIVSLQAGSDRT